MGELYGCFVSQNTKFSETVPIHLIKRAFRKMFQFYGGHHLMCLPRANFEMFGNRNFIKIQSKLPIEMHRQNP